MREDLMLMVQFFTKSEVISKYGIRTEFEEKFFEKCPVAFLSNGEPVFKESDVDEYVRWFRSPPYIHPSRRRGGQPSKNGQVKQLALRLKSQGKDWKEVTKEVNTAFPKADGSRRTPDSIRKLVARHSATVNNNLRTDGHVQEASEKGGR